MIARRVRPPRDACDRVDGVELVVLRADEHGEAVMGHGRGRPHVIARRVRPPRGARGRVLELPPNELPEDAIGGDRSPATPIGLFE